MTTIATDGKVMAGDGRTNYRSIIVHDETRKLRRLADGAVAGFCGSDSEIALFVKWKNEGGDKPNLASDFGALVLNRDGTCDWFSANVIPCRVHLPMAMGSGMDLALGAMWAGKTPEEAVRCATSYDPFTGGKITTLTLEGDQT